MLRILEISWLLISVATGTISAYQFVTDGWQAAIWMLAITGVALLMYTVRKKQRVRMEQHQREQDGTKYH
ncbi:MAG: hypothetical protein IPG90_01560 [Bacteroidetes bacterium]|jgi:hypothetical protein|nr:hypothetical protein [Bacteroidota bacterium]MBP6403187.1 hypothetical protein [Bacteroidia bacterium]MBK6837115.1 hypothetical protein [Bacteroidota bacterium]MBK9523490.1 hypothetical protein [Bacteroidota bacterium]MBK9541235.1 hypothetical protein [Bacteroidota bacterium]